MPGPSERHVEEPAFLGELVRLSWGRDQVKERIVIDLRRESPPLVGQVEHNHVIRLAALGRVHRAALHWSAA